MAIRFLLQSLAIHYLLQITCFRNMAIRSLLQNYDYTFSASELWQQVLCFRRQYVSVSEIWQYVFCLRNIAIRFLLQKYMYGNTCSASEIWQYVVFLRNMATSFMARPRTWTWRWQRRTARRWMSMTCWSCPLCPPLPSCCPPHNQQSRV